MRSDNAPWIAICVGLALLILFLASQVVLSYRNGDTIVTTTRLRLRAWPTTGSELLTVIDNGVPLVVHGRFFRWLKVEHRGQVGFVHSEYVSLVVEPPPVPTPGHARGLRPEHGCVLEQTGYFEYVVGHVDEIQYFAWSSFDTSVGPAIGLAEYENGVRKALIATEGRDDLEIVTTIVHEAVHLAGLTEIGRMHEQDVAERIERQFVRDLQSLPPYACEGVPYGR